MLQRREKLALSAAIRRLAHLHAGYLRKHIEYQVMVGLVANFEMYTHMSIFDGYEIRSTGPSLPYLAPLVAVDLELRGRETSISGITPRPYPEGKPQIPETIRHVRSPWVQMPPISPEIDHMAGAITSGSPGVLKSDRIHIWGSSTIGPCPGPTSSYKCIYNCHSGIATPHSHNVSRQIPIIHHDMSYRFGLHAHWLRQRESHNRVW
jgi:hypothetical protein